MTDMDLPLRGKRALVTGSTANGATLRVNGDGVRMIR
jgi:hypothetical protein